jgi:hypothetical protein
VPFVSSTEVTEVIRATCFGPQRRRGLRVSDMLLFGLELEILVVVSADSNIPRFSENLCAILCANNESSTQRIAVAIGRAGGNAQHFGGLLTRQSGEVTQFDEPGLKGVAVCEFSECQVNGE